MTPDWTDAACREYYPDTWFPEPAPGRGGSRDWRTPRRICAGCPIRDACLAWALANPRQSSHGMFGGLNPKQRTELRNRRRSAA